MLEAQIVSSYTLMASVPSPVSLKEVSSCWVCQCQQVMVVANSDSIDLAPQML